MPMQRGNTESESLALTSVNTLKLGHALGIHVEAGQVIALQGDLGAGKTTFTQGLAAGMGIDDHVTSPTFTLVNEYASGERLRLIHVDTYRLDELPEYAMLESATFGLEDILDPANLVSSSESGAVVVIEWAERVAALLPEDYLLIQITSAPDPHLRDVACTAYGSRSVALLRRLVDLLPV